MSWYFDGSGGKEYLDFGDPTFLDGESLISGSIWINPDNATSDRHVFAKYAGTSTGGFVIVQDLAGGTTGNNRCWTIVHRDTGSGVVKVEGDDESVVSGVWQNIIWTWDEGGTMHLYVDGVEQDTTGNSPANSSGNTTFPNITHSLRVGASPSSNGLEGFAEDANLWLGTIPAEQIEAIGVHRYAGSNFPNNLVFHSPMIAGRVNNEYGVEESTEVGTPVVGVEESPNLIWPSGQRIRS